MYEKYRFRDVDYDFERDCLNREVPNYSESPLTLPAAWSSDELLKHGFEVALETSAEHHVGGVPQHTEAVCPHCRQLLWVALDLNLSDEGLPKTLRDEFSSQLTRLQIYYCPRCPVGTCYRLISDSKIQMLACASQNYDYKQDQSELTPFAAEKDLISVLKKRAVDIRLIPEQVQVDMLALWNDRCNRKETIDEKRRSEVLNHFHLESEWGLPISQFYGVPIFAQGHWQDACVNTECPLSCESVTIQSVDGTSQDSQGLMPFAYLTGRVIRELEEFHADIRVRICWCCLTIYTDYECS